MDFIQKIKNINNLDEPSLEEQVTKWKTNLGEGEVYKIMFPENEISFINEHVYDDLEFFNTNDGNGEGGINAFSSSEKL